MSRDSASRRSAGGAGTDCGTVAKKAAIEFRSVERLQRIRSRQANQVRAPGVGITPEVLDRLRWGVTGTPCSVSGKRLTEAVHPGFATRAPTLGDGHFESATWAASFEVALAVTRGDAYRSLPGYQVIGGHKDANVARDLVATGSMDTRLEDFAHFRAAGITIASPVDRPRDVTRLEELRWLFEGARRHSDDDFLVLSEPEIGNISGGLRELLFPHPVYYVDARASGTPIVTEYSVYAPVHSIGSAEDVVGMVAAE